jgi:hypothetical protein
MANSFREIRRKPPLFEHRGDRSTLAKSDLSHPDAPLNWTKKMNLKYDDFKVDHHPHRLLFFGGGGGQTAILNFTPGPQG